MTGEVVCPSCGRGNERGLAETYRMCVHCGADISGALSGPTGVEVHETSLEDFRVWQNFSKQGNPENRQRLPKSMALLISKEHKRISVSLLFAMKLRVLKKSI